MFYYHKLNQLGKSLRLAVKGSGEGSERVLEKFLSFLIKIVLFLEFHCLLT